jgi:hypothetical protein
MVFGKLDEEGKWEEVGEMMEGACEDLDGWV